MKYSVKQIESGEWAVFNRKGAYYTFTVSSTKLAAEQHKQLYIMRDAQEIIDQAWDKLVKMSDSSEYDESVRLVGSDSYSTKGDFLA